MEKVCFVFIQGNKYPGIIKGKNIIYYPGNLGKVTIKSCDVKYKEVSK